MPTNVSCASSTRTCRPSVAERRGRGRRPPRRARRASGRARATTRPAATATRPNGSPWSSHAVAMSASSAGNASALGVEAHADDHRARAVGLGEDARELAVVDHEVVRPLHARPSNPADRAHRLGRGDGRGQRHQVHALGRQLRAAAAPTPGARRPAPRSTCGRAGPGPRSARRPPRPRPRPRTRGPAASSR